MHPVVRLFVVSHPLFRVFVLQRVPKIFATRRPQTIHIFFYSFPTLSSFSFSTSLTSVLFSFRYFFCYSTWSQQPFLRNFSATFAFVSRQQCIAAVRDDIKICEPVQVPSSLSFLSLYLILYIFPTPLPTSQNRWKKSPPPK